MANHNTLDALSEGTVSGFFEYVKRSQPQLNESEVMAEVKQMLRVVGWRENAIADLVDVVFGE